MGATYKLKRKTGANTTEEVLFPIASVDGLQTALNGKLGTSAKAADSAKLNGQAASYYLNYTNFTNKPTIPTATSQLTNDSGFLTTETYKGTVTSVKVGTTSYTPSSGVVSLPAYPTVPSVGNGTITIKQAGTVKGTFTTNQSGDTTIELGDACVIQSHTTKDANYPLLFKLASGITTTGITTNSTRYANNIYVNPAKGTIYANDFVVGGKSIVGVGGGVSSLYGDWELPSQAVSAGDDTYLYFDVPPTAKIIEVWFEKQADISFKISLFYGDFVNVDTSIIPYSADICSLVIDVFSRTATLYGYDTDDEWPAMAFLGTLPVYNGEIGSRIVIYSSAGFSADAVFTARGTSYYFKASENY